MHKHFQLLRDERFARPIACSDGYKFVTQFPSLKEAWPKFARSDWMMWLLEKIGYSQRRKLVLIATRFIREILVGGDKFVFDILPKDAIAPFLVIERYALGEDISQSEIDAAYTTAYAADTAATRAAAAYAYTTIHADPDAALGAAAAAATYARKIQCDIIRSVISWAEVSKLINRKCKELGIK